MSENYDTAVRLIDESLKQYKSTSRIVDLIRYPVADALKQFVRDPEFADAVVAKGENGFSDCLTEITKGVGASLSDIETYRRAASFFFPGCGVSFRMEIDLTAAANGRKDILPGGRTVGEVEALPDADFQPTEKPDDDKPTEPRKISIDLDDLFD